MIFCALERQDFHSLGQIQSQVSPIEGADGFGDVFGGEGLCTVRLGEGVGDF
jgi:hypothetical protein